MIGAHHVNEQGGNMNVSSQGPVVHVTSAKTGNGIPQFMLSIASDLWLDGKISDGLDSFFEEQ